MTRTWETLLPSRAWATFRRESPSSTDLHTKEVVIVGILYLDTDDVALCQPFGVAQVDFAIDLGRVGLRTASRAAFVIDDVDDHLEGPADLRLKFGGGYRRGSSP